MQSGSVSPCKPFTVLCTRPIREHGLCVTYSPSVAQGGLPSLQHTDSPGHHTVDGDGSYDVALPRGRGPRRHPHFRHIRRPQQAGRVEQAPRAVPTRTRTRTSSPLDGVYNRIPRTAHCGSPRRTSTSTHNIRRARGAHAPPIRCLSCAPCTLSQQFLKHLIRGAPYIAHFAATCDLRRSLSITPIHPRQRTRAEGKNSHSSAVVQTSNHAVLFVRCFRHLPSCLSLPPSAYLYTAITKLKKSHCRSDLRLICECPSERSADMNLI